MMAKWAMIARIGLVLVLALAFSVVETQDASAQCGMVGGGGYGYGGYCGAGGMYRVLSQNVPYFAAFPPVYYSAPVPRTYGYSPFAYPPGTRTPDLPTPTIASKEILNPYVQASEVTEKKTKQEATDKVTQGDSTPEPLAIFNPFVGPYLHTASLVQ